MWAKQLYTVAGFRNTSYIMESYISQLECNSSLPSRKSPISNLFRPHPYLYLRFSHFPIRDLLGFIGAFEWKVKCLSSMSWSSWLWTHQDGGDLGIFFWAESLGFETYAAPLPQQNPGDKFTYPSKKGPFWQEDSSSKPSMFMAYVGFSGVYPHGVVSEQGQLRW